MAFIREHRALLDAPIYAEQPQLLYPLVRTALNGESMIAVYGSGFTAVLEDVKTTWLINAADPSGVVVEAPKALQAAVYDCMGQFVQDQPVAQGLTRLPIPLGGFAVIKN